MSRTYQNLGELREKLTGFRRQFVASRLGLEEAALEAIENGTAQPSVWQLDALARLFGLDLDTLSSEPIQIAAGDGIATLALQPEFRPASDITREAIVASANAARDANDLARLLDPEFDSRAQFRGERPSLRPPRPEALPHVEGREAAKQLRQYLEIGADVPVPSMRDLVSVAFPSVTVLHCDLKDPQVSGLSFCDATRGPTIVLNLHGKNDNPCVRRFSLAHELAHLLLDWNQMEPLATLTVHQDEAKFQREQCANAFAAYLLCPRPVVQQYARDFGATEAASALVEDFGLHYSAVRLQLEKVASVRVPPRRSEFPRRPSAVDGWARAEHREDLDRSGFDNVPPERRTRIAELAAEAYSRGLVSKDRLADLLGTPGDAEPERILDYFGFDPPVADANYC